MDLVDAAPPAAAHDAHEAAGPARADAARGRVGDAVAHADRPAAGTAGAVGRGGRADAGVGEVDEGPCDVREDGHDAGGDGGGAVASLLGSFGRLDCLDVGSGKVSIWACMRLWVWSLQPMDSMVTLVA